MATSEEIQIKVDKLAVNMDRFDSITNGADTENVTVDTGVVPSVRKLFKQIREQVFQPPVAFTSGLTASDGSFTVEQGDVIYAARPDQTPFTTTGTFDSSQWYPVIGDIDNDVLYVAGLSVDDTGAVEATAAIQPYIGTVSEIVFPAGTFYVSLDVDSPLRIRGAGRGLTKLTTVTETNGLTIDVNADFEFSDLTIECHPTSATARTINHDGAHSVIGTNFTLTGCNHTMAKAVNSVARYTNFNVVNGPQPAALGALCHSPLAVYINYEFMGGRCVEANDGLFLFGRIGSEDETTTGVHMPEGATANDGSPTGFSGAAEFHHLALRANGSGITEGNDCHCVLRHSDVRASYGAVAGTALYARSKSTFDVEDSYIEAVTGNALSFAKTVPQDPNSIGLTGESYIKRSTLKGGNTSLAVPSATGTYPLAIGNVILTDVNIVGGDNEISPNNSTYHIFKTEKFVDYTEALVYTANDTTQRFRFKSDGMMVTVSGSDGPRTGCHLSHLDALTGLPHPDGMEIWFKYGGVSSRFVTFANGATDDGGAMYFADNASTLATTQFGMFKMRLDSTTWKQIDG